VVGVDPADSGSGDACGIVVASMTGEGVVAVIADVSAPMTSDQWARAAVDLAVDVGASEIAVEGIAARETYRRVVNDALRRTKIDRPIRVTTWPPKGSGRGGSDPLARSAALLQGLETGTSRIAGHLPALEGSAVTWQAGQHQPDSLAAVVVAHDVLIHSAGHQVHFVSPLDVERRMRAQPITSIPAYLRRRIG
jgi:phage terminase large subunit-like protein